MAGDGGGLSSGTEHIQVHELVCASRRPEVISAMKEFYAELDHRISVRQPTCWNQGLCCRFGEFGHRLYVTALEACYYLSGNYQRPLIIGDACPHAYDKACHARDHRPMGCRIFFCDPATRDWQGPLTEEFLARLRKMHDQLGVCYFYADWMKVLQALEDSNSAAAGEET